jgi:hypothetical protein
MEQSPSGDPSVTLIPKKFPIFYETRRFFGFEIVRAETTKSRVIFWVVMPRTSGKTWNFREHTVSIFRADG